MSRMLTLQLERFGRLSPEEKLALGGITLRPRRLSARADFSCEASVDSTPVLLTGIACRYVLLPNGRRQILAYLLPGELCDRQTGDRMFTDHCVGTLSSAKVGTFFRDDIARLSRAFPQIARAFELSRAVEQATLRQWLLGVGHRQALERTAHLLCELFTRLRALGLVQGRTCELGLRQSDLADALGLSAVHLNRTLTEMRRRRIVTFVRHQLVIFNWRALRTLCGFRSDYLFAGAPPALEQVQDESEGEEGNAGRPLREPGRGALPEQEPLFKDSGVPLLSWPAD